MVTDLGVLQELFERMPVGVTVMEFPTDDPDDGRLIWVNDAANLHAGVDLRQLLGRSRNDDDDPMLHSSESADSNRLAFNVANGGGPMQFAAYEVTEGDGAGRYQLTMFPMRDRRMATVFRRVDAEVESQRALDWAMQSLEEANKGLERFAATVAHDLKNPLAGIAGNAELAKLAGGDLSVEAAAALDRVIELSRLSSSMIDDLLRYARTVGTDPTDGVDLRSVVDWVTNLLADRIETESAVVEIEGDAQVVGNEAALRQVVLNLFANSLRYRHAERRPEIRVVVSRAGSRVDVRIVDNGLGIPAHKREDVFEWGVRNETLDTAPGGSGIGLAACRAVLTNLGGTIQAVDPDRFGTVMLLRFQSADPNRQQ